jgi:hypothetical protein
MNRRNTLLALIIVASMISISMTVPHSVDGAWDSLYLVPGQYTGTHVYTPGETIHIVLRGDSAEYYSVYSLILIEEPILENVRLDEEGEATVSFLINEFTPDGNYTIIVRDTGGIQVDMANFTVQGYVFLIETDRDAYLDGDVMKIFWTANNLKDQTLPPPPQAGYASIRVHNETMILYEEYLDTSAGSISYSLPPIITNYNEGYWVDGWFNDSASATPIRNQYSRADFDMKRLGVLIDLDKEQYALGSLLAIQVKTVVTDNQSYPSELDTAEPGCEVSIEIFNINDQIAAIYQIAGLETDSHGIVRHIVSLDAEDFTDDSDYIVRVEAKKSYRDRSEETGFTISESSSLSVVLDFNKAEYTSGETMYLNASASSIGGGSEFTFLIEIRDTNATGTLFFRQTQSSNEFVFNIPDNFVEGWLWTQVTADDGEGNSASVMQNVEVVYAIVLVNVDKENYVSNDVLGISYDVVGQKMADPNTFYVVSDSEGYVVDEGVATEGSFTFTIPAAPSSSYIFTVFASQDGRIVQGYDAAELFSSFVLTIEFNKNSYGPGDTMAIDYQIFALGDANLPTTFVIAYGLENGPLASLQTSEPVGTLNYFIPEDIDEGNQLFRASCDFGGDVNEIVTIKRGANPLWYLTVRDIPIFVMFLFFLVLISLYFTYRSRKRLAEFQKGHTAAEKTRRPVLDAGASMATTECIECGNPIEITTSRRPIEVMCPHCGEIQHVEK